MIDIINDISVLTTIPAKTFDKLVKKSVYCICDAIVEDRLGDEDITTVDLGIGTLFIKHLSDSGDGIKYHFEPSVYMSKAIKACISTNQNPLEDVLLTGLKEKFIDVYKDLC